MMAHFNCHSSPWKGKTEIGKSGKGEVMIAQSEDALWVLMQE
jgi:hypothetical protein